MACDLILQRRGAQEEPLASVRINEWAFILRKNQPSEH